MPCHPDRVRANYDAPPRASTTCDEHVFEWLDPSTDEIRCRNCGYRTRDLYVVMRSKKKK